MATLQYFNDGKGKYQSHELYLKEDISVNSAGSYGANLVETLRYLMNECVSKRNSLNRLISDISSRNLKFVDVDDNPVEKEQITDYYSGDVSENDITFAIKHVKTIGAENESKISRIREDVERYCTGHSVGKWSKSRSSQVNKFLDDMVDGFLQIPIMIVVPYNRKLQMTWKTDQGILFVLHITAAKIEFYMSFRNVFSKVPDSYIEVENLDQVIFILKSYGLYREY